MFIKMHIYYYWVYNSIKYEIVYLYLFFNFKNYLDFFLITFAEFISFPKALGCTAATFFFAESGLLGFYLLG
jgi:hypothetical protein